MPTTFKPPFLGLMQQPNPATPTPQGSGATAYAGPGDLGTLDVSFALYPSYTLSGATDVGFQTDSWSSPSIVARPTGTFSSGTVDLVSGFLHMQSGNGLELAILTFTAPTADNYTFAGRFADQDVAGGGGVEVEAVLGNGIVLLPVKFMPAVSSPVAIKFLSSLAAGEKVYFALGANGSYDFDSTVSG